MPQLINSATKFWLKPGATVLNTLEIRIECSNMHAAISVKEIWEEHQYWNFYKQNCYSWKNAHFVIHDAKVQLINETTIQVLGLVGGQNFVNDFCSLLHKIPFVKAQIKCKDDRNPICPSIYQIKTRQQILPDNIVSVYLFKIFGNRIVLL